MTAARDPGTRTLRQRLLFARLAILWEEAGPALWPIPALIAAFVALALLGLPPLLPGWLHVALLAAFAAALIAFVPRLFRLAWPSADAGRRRLERASGLGHGPLQALADDLAAGADDPVARSLWDAYRRRLGATLAQLKLPLPGPVLARHDPLGLRFAALLLLAVALPGGWRDAPDRLERALKPDMNWLIGPPPTLQVWVTPPDYTRVAPILLENVAPGTPVTIPAGSKVLAELQGGRGTASLQLDGAQHDFQRLDPASQRFEATLTASGPIAVRQGWRKLGEWQLVTLADLPPTIEFAKMPDADPRGRLRFDIKAGDDYGIARAWVEVRRADGANGEPLAVELPLAGHPRQLRQASWHDLTSHPWAGLKVTLTPHAADDPGQIGSGAPVTITLPERVFRHPVARALIAIRKELAADPGDRDSAIDGIEDIYAVPRAWGGDVVVALALADAMARLYHDRGPRAVPSVLDTLWQTALRLEEGDRPLADRAVDEAAQALEKALADNAPESEIERLTAELKAAIDRLLQAIVQQALQNGQMPPEAAPGEQTVTQQDLDRMLAQMQDMVRTGSRDAARQTLDQLRQILDALRAGRPSLANRETMEQARRASDAMQKLIQDQEGLLNDTFRRNQQAQRPGPDQQGAGRQEELRRRLGDAMQMLGDLGADIPDALGEAEQAMREATQAMHEGNGDGAVQAQTRAVAKLREGAQAANQAMARQLGNGPGMVRMPGPGEGDPLGRPLENGRGNPDDPSVKIPAAADLQKAREVLDELRRRSGEAHRPTAEREYLDRLLQHLF